MKISLKLILQGVQTGAFGEFSKVHLPVSKLFDYKTFSKELDSITSGSRGVVVSCSGAVVSAICDSICSRILFP